MLHVSNGLLHIDTNWIKKDVSVCVCVQQRVFSALLASQVGITKHVNDLFIFILFIIAIVFFSL